jgi:hypothetical protein
MAWMRQVCGRLESRYRYSIEIVYNNFPWPSNPPEKQIENVRDAMNCVLDARNALNGQTLANLYDTDVMPKPLRKAHESLDKVVDFCYGRRLFDTDLSRVKFLFERHNVLILAGQACLKLDDPTSRKRRKSTDKKSSKKRSTD